MTFFLFQTPLPESYLDVADKLEELANSIARLPEVDPELIARFRSFGTRMRAEMQTHRARAVPRAVDIIV